MERIESLRNRIFEGDFLSDRFYYLFYKKYSLLADLSEEERYAESFCYAILNLTPSITEGELILGKRDVPLSDSEKREWEEIYQPIAFARRDKAGAGQDSHMAIDYELILKFGINGIIDKINTYIKNCNTKKLAFYKSCKRCLEAVIKHSEDYGDAALRMSKQTNSPSLRVELEEIAEICKKVPANPAESFHEAVQSVHFITYCISFNPFRMCFQQFQLGHLDRYLYPFYKNDMEKGVLTKEYAQLLLDCLGIQINMRVPNGLSSGYMVGGRDENGDIVANDLTEMCMQVIEDIRLVYPAVGFCYTDDMPEKYLEKACALLSKGYSHPAIFNDDIISEGLMYYGVPENEAHNYIHSTCVEITPVSSSNVWVASPYTNMPQLLLDSLDREYSDLEELIDSIFAKLDKKIENNYLIEKARRCTRAKNSINPLLSCFVNDCLERGTDIERGGAKYNWIMPSFVGMANLVDSLFAIKHLVFEQKKVSVQEFKSILDNDFKGNEDLRLYILKKIPKYGNDIDEIDCYFNIFVEHIIKECEKYFDNENNEKLIPSVFCWIMHEMFGRETSATPDGRPAGFPLGDGSGPCQGKEMNGPTASVLSSTKWDHHKLIGGVAVNLKFAKVSLGNDSIGAIKAIVKTFLKRGGFELQINVISNYTLKKALENPEEYRDLIVRVGGYSDYFVRLSPEMQKEIIARTEHQL